MAGDRSGGRQTIILIPGTQPDSPSMSEAHRGGSHLCLLTSDMLLGQVYFQMIWKLSGFLEQFMEDDHKAVLPTFITKSTM